MIRIISLASHALESTVPSHVHSVALATCILIILGGGSRVVAGSDCVEQPNQEPVQGAHWYYHYDREKNRKCWHLEAVEMRVPESPQKDQSGAPMTIGSVFTSLFRAPAIVPLTSAPEPAAGEPRIIQSNPTKPLKLDDIAQQQPDLPEERAEPRYVTPLTPAQRKALFEEYLRWVEIQRNLDGLGVPARSP